LSSTRFLNCPRQRHTQGLGAEGPLLAARVAGAPTPVPCGEPPVAKPGVERGRGRWGGGGAGHFFGAVPTTAAMRPASMPLHCAPNIQFPNRASPSRKSGSTRATQARRGYCGVEQCLCEACAEQWRNDKTQSRHERSSERKCKGEQSQVRGRVLTGGEEVHQQG